ncbi:hypothetical protein MCOR25_005763 [Pyricularia grisea]|nr:hypothetical protein MCOR25_005763 [Pyricularia grisea]
MALSTAATVFFVLGGDSIKAMELVALARKNSLDLSVATAFAQPTLAGMAELYHGVPRWPCQRRRARASDQRDDQAKQTTPLVATIVPCTDYQATFLAGMMAFPGAHLTQHVFKLNQTVGMARIHAAVDACMAQFPTLRAHVVVDQDDGSLKLKTQHFKTTAWDWHEGHDPDVLLAQDATAAWDL